MTKIKHNFSGLSLIIVAIILSTSIILPAQCLSISSVTFDVKQNNDVVVNYKLVLKPDEKKIIDSYRSEFLKNMTDNGFITSKSKDSLSFTVPSYAYNFTDGKNTTYLFPGFFYSDIIYSDWAPEEISLLNILADNNLKPDTAQIKWPDGTVTTFKGRDYIPTIHRIIQSPVKRVK